MSAVRQFISWFNSIDWTPETVTAAGTVALAFLTLVLATGALFLWLATRRLVKESERTAERQLRAYVFILGGSVKIVKMGGTNALGYKLDIKLQKLWPDPCHKIQNMD